MYCISLSLLLSLFSLLVGFRERRFTAYLVLENAVITLN